MSMDANPLISSPETHQGSKGPAEGTHGSLRGPGGLRQLALLAPGSAGLSQVTYTHKMAALAGQSLAETLLCFSVSWGAWQDLCCLGGRGGCAAGDWGFTTNPASNCSAQTKRAHEQEFRHEGIY